MYYHYNHVKAKVEHVEEKLSLPLIQSTSKKENGIFLFLLMKVKVHNVLQNHFYIV